MTASVLVTGGGGFIGSWVLRELLAAGQRAVALDLRPNPTRWQRILGRHADDVVCVTGSLLDRSWLHDVLRQHEISHIIHLAALLTPDCQTDPYMGCQINVLGSVALFEAARSMGASLRGFSYASSLAVYGPEVDDDPSTATRENRPATFYGAFKKSLEMIAEQYWSHYGIASLGLRPHVVYGPERDSGLSAGPSLAARAAAEGRRYKIGYVGRAGYDYVEDVARAFVRGALETPRGAYVADLPSETSDAFELVAVIRGIVPGAEISADGPALPHNTPPRPAPITQYLPDWRATSIEEGMRKTVDFYRNS